MDLRSIFVQTMSGSAPVKVRHKIRSSFANPGSPTRVSVGFDRTALSHGSAYATEAQCKRQKQ
jgi:hypothetical protein